MPENISRIPRQKDRLSQNNALQDSRAERFANALQNLVRPLAGVLIFTAALGTFAAVTGHSEILPAGMVPISGLLTANWIFDALKKVWGSREQFSKLKLRQIDTVLEKHFQELIDTNQISEEKLLQGITEANQQISAFLLERLAVLEDTIAQENNDSNKDLLEKFAVIMKENFVRGFEYQNDVLEQIVQISIETPEEIINARNQILSAIVQGSDKIDKLSERIDNLTEKISHLQKEPFDDADVRRKIIDRTQVPGGEPLVFVSFSQENQVIAASRRRLFAFDRTMQLQAITVLNHDNVSEITGLEWLGQMLFMTTLHGEVIQLLSGNKFLEVEAVVMKKFESPILGIKTDGRDKLLVNLPNGVLHLLDFTERVTDSFSFSGPIKMATQSDSGRYILVVKGNGITCWDRVRDKNLVIEAPNSISCMTVSNAGTVFFGTSSGEILSVSQKDKQMRRLMNAGLSRITKIELGQNRMDREYVAFSTEEGEIYLLSRNLKQIKWHVKSNDGEILDLKSHGDYLISTSSKGFLTVWNLLQK